MTASNELVEEIDRIRDEAQAAFIARDVEQYMRMFSRDVVYKLKNGTILGYDRLAEDILKQLRVIPSIEISRTRDSFDLVDDRFVEVVTQSTVIKGSFLFLITRTIHMTRQGRYVWSRTPAGRQVVEVEILDEAMTSQWALGFLKPRRVF